MTKEWFTAAELAGLDGMPAHATNVTRKAKNKNWQHRQIAGLRGVNFEYHASSLPKETQVALGLEGLDKPVEAENSDSDMVTIQIYSAKAKTWSKARAVAHMMLPKAFLPKPLPHTEQNQLFALEMPDNTMQPTISSGEVILVSKADSKATLSTGLFLVETSTEVTIRRLKPNVAATQIKVCCDSEQYDDETLSKDDFNQSIRVIGKVIGTLIKTVV
ncbi:hypothetical protein OFY17_05160 [Marinomonas sp. C2222]|uniref:HTH Mu-type domain-containing protein n=1 Tax=Marinomonas sargassi TaxID=2984494 RepID=A0ABT2YQV5_9GAMM|nr:DNA-binding protein [Marinomonas sargassi]MCV2402273.1 hypothetical protein [Marinomonas sargassi]